MGVLPFCGDRGPSDVYGNNDNVATPKPIVTEMANRAT